MSLNFFALMASGSAVFFSVVWLAVQEGRRRGRAEAELEFRQRGQAAQRRVSARLETKVGNRKKLLQWLEAKSKK